MAIPTNSDFNQLTVWLSQNLLSQNSFVPHLDSIPNINSKGIYFWFMHPDGYKALSNCVSIKPTEPKYTRNIDGVIYDLVYLGTAGTGKKGNSNITERFVWHINQNHTASNICHGTLSTLRAGVGALLSNDLIDTDTEKVVNDFMKQYMKVFWIEYLNDNDLIDNDEKILINGIKPLLNLKNNPNARCVSIINSTKVYKIRRAEVYNNTRLRMECKGESEQSKKTNKIPTKDSPSFVHQVYSVENKCVEFFVLKNQSILDVVRGIEDLPDEACTFQILNSNTGLLVSEFKGWNTTGTKVHINPKAQNIYTYFSATGGKIDGRGTARWIHIQNRMNKRDDEIEEITIKVCSPHKITDKKNILEKIAPTKTNNTDMEMENIILSKNFKVVMVCAGRKNNSYFTAYPNENFVNIPGAGVVNEHHPDDLINNIEIRWRDYLINNQNDYNLLEAYNLYKREEYRSLHRKYKHNFYILSAGWGLVNSEFKLPKYDITFSTGVNVAVNTRRNSNLVVLPTYDDLIQIDANNKEDIVFFGGKDYLNLFCNLTMNLNCRKIIFYFGVRPNIPNWVINPINFYFVRYISDNNRGWHYEAACDL